MARYYRPTDYISPWMPDADAPAREAKREAFLIVSGLERFDAPMLDHDGPWQPYTYDFGHALLAAAAFAAGVMAAYAWGVLA